ncbi:MAG: phage antirepressor KilAC domain-containing protein [Blautia sp.]|nr:phage antirepressor KilAC domain-containing protein [Blautia sp.]
MQTENDEQKGMIATMQPKAEYFDALVDRNLLTGFRETAKDLHWKEGEFREFLLGCKYLYRDRKNRLQPYAVHVDNGLFVLKECMSNKNNWAGTQIMFTPKARETFRLLKKTEGTAS